MRRATWIGAAAVALAASAGAGPAVAALPYDFDADGRQDLTIGVPGWAHAGAANSGAAFVLGGARREAQVLMEGANGIPGVPEGDDGFGSALASGDFDGDGAGDLALASAGEGRVSVLYGGPRGLSGWRVQLLEQAGPLAAGDLDGCPARGGPWTRSAPP